MRASQDLWGQQQAKLVSRACAAEAELKWAMAELAAETQRADASARQVQELKQALADGAAHVCPTVAAQVRHTTPLARRCDALTTCEPAFRRVRVFQAMGACTCRCAACEAGHGSGSTTGMDSWRSRTRSPVSDAVASAPSRDGGFVESRTGTPSVDMAGTMGSRLEQVCAAARGKRWLVLG